LIHLGGQDLITAYNIEDNELWMRHVLTAVSQITVSMYILRSWRGTDFWLLRASFNLFVPGFLKCLEKPWALKSASINSLISSPVSPPPRTEAEIQSLEEFVQKARGFISTQKQGEDDDAVDLETAQLEGVQTEPAKPTRWALETHKVFMDHTSPYSHRLHVLQSFWLLDDVQVYALLRDGISHTFDLLYTKRKTSYRSIPGIIKMVAIIQPFYAVYCFHKSKRRVNMDNDVKVTYALLCCTAALQLLNYVCGMRSEWSMSSMVAQYSLTGFFAHKRKNKKIGIIGLSKCRDFLDQQWRMKPCSSTPRIAKLVLGHAKCRWKEHILDAPSYRRFNDHRGQWTFRHVQHGQDLLAIKRPFDESVLLWHIATDLCFYFAGHASPDHGCATAQCEGSSIDECATWRKTSPRHASAVGCREMSNYMVYLLFVNPEMLIAGTRRNIFTAAHDELDKFLKDEDLPPGERAVTQRIIAKMLRSSQDTQKGFIQDAWMLALALVDLGDDKMWEVIEGVWVEMLCFSASRCRGYLHAKSLGTGGELLTYVWLLLSHIGMETLPERLQRAEESS
jgi:hypothetical protein